MSTAVIVLNVVFSVSVITCTVGLLLWGIVTQRRDHPARQTVNVRRPTRAVGELRPVEASSAAAA